ncbi:MAG TPA: CheR family methyltransferase [Candidatus Saccharimonadales bacterium]|nr:CheR family methyltransferase [Candidatus Saccharimonadales bacterium]
MGSTERAMTPALFRRFCRLAYEQAGISLHAGKEALVAARVGKRVRALSLESEAEYLEYLEADATGEELVHFLDAISTNFTSFLREPDHFEELKKVVLRRLAEGQKVLRLWSAACSSGEEPYSMALAVLESLGGKPLEFRILATDISHQMLAQAERGVYSAERLAPLSRAQRARYFTPHVDGGPPGAPRYQVLPEVRAHVVFRRLNLSLPPFPMKGRLDVVFCRNVLIYFDRPVRQQLIQEIERLLRPGGTLALGHTETLTGIRSRLRMVRPSVFVLPEEEAEHP